MRFRAGPAARGQIQKGGPGKARRSHVVGRAMGTSVKGASWQIYPLYASSIADPTRHLADPSVKPPLAGLRIFITHIKEYLVPHPSGKSARERIMSELRELEKEGRMGVEFIEVKQGHRICEFWPRSLTAGSPLRDGPRRCGRSEADASNMIKRVDPSTGRFRRICAWYVRSALEAHAAYGQVEVAERRR